MRPPSARSPDTPASHGVGDLRKAPILGEAKTRLCPSLIPDEAVTLHDGFVLDMLDRTTLLSGLSLGN